VVAPEAMLRSGPYSDQRPVLPDGTLNAPLNAPVVPPVHVRYMDSR
jgi:hypothetical protein